LNKKFFITWLVVFVLWFIGVYVINAILLLDDWMPVPLLRGWEGELKVYHFMVLPFVLWSGSSVWVYQNFARREPWLQRGLLFGVVLALLTIIPMRMINYASLQLPGMVLVKECIYQTILLLILGVVIAWFYREREPAGR
jgi:hypothetical protein